MINRPGSTLAYSFKEQPFCPQDASPSWKSGFLPPSCPVLTPDSPNTSICRLGPISEFPSPPQLQHYLYQQSWSRYPGALTWSVHSWLVAQSHAPCALLHHLSQKRPSSLGDFPLFFAAYTLTWPRHNLNPTVLLNIQPRNSPGFEGFHDENLMTGSHVM